MNIKNLTLRKPKKGILRNKSELYLHVFNDAEPTHLKNVHKEELLLSLKMYLKLHGKNRHKIKKSILERVAADAPDGEVNAVTDFDLKFYSCVDGRPIKDRNSYLTTVKLAISKLMRIRHEIGYKIDGIKHIDTIYTNELKMYNKTVAKCLEQEKLFNCFVFEDYGKSINFLNKCNLLNNKLDQKISEIYSIANEEFTITSRLMTLDYLYRIQQIYGRFLYYLSPPAWRSQNREFAQSVEIEAKGFDLGHSSEDDTFNAVFDKLQNECKRNQIKPVLCFTRAEDLIDIFDRIQKQQLHHFAYVTHLAPLKNKIKEGIKCIKDMFIQESAFVNNTIQSLEKFIKLKEERCAHLRSRFFTILNGMFYENVGSQDVLKLQVHLEFCYEKVYAEKPVNMDIMLIAGSLEKFYLKHINKIDELYCETIKRSFTHCIQTDRRILKQANNAAREIRLFDRLERQLQLSFQPAQPPSLNRLKVLSQSRHIPKLKKQGCPKSEVKKENILSDSEIDFLTLFTDWTDGDDPYKYIHKNKISMVKGESSKTSGGGSLLK